MVSGIWQQRRWPSTTTPIQSKTEYEDTHHLFHQLYDSVDKLPHPFLEGLLVNQAG
jgi:hypothetical protein